MTPTDPAILAAARSAASTAPELTAERLQTVVAILAASPLTDHAGNQAA